MLRCSNSVENLFSLCIVSVQIFQRQMIVQFAVFEAITFF